MIIGFLLIISLYGLSWVHSRSSYCFELPVFARSTVSHVKSYSDSVALYNVSAMAYLRYGINPVYPLVDLQDWQASFSDEYRDWLLGMYEEGDAEYILVQSKTDGPEPVSQPVLDSRYELVEEGDI